MVSKCLTSFTLPCCRVVSRCFSRCIRLFRFVSHRIIFCQAVSRHVISFHVMSCQMSCHVLFFFVFFHATVCHANVSRCFVRNYCFMLCHIATSAVMFCPCYVLLHVRVARRKNGRRRYRWVSAEGWAMVKKLFPQAAELEYPAGTEPCSQCEEQVGWKTHL